MNRSLALGQCPPLPSQGSAQAFVDGKPGALPLVLLHMAGRGALVGAGIYAFAGEKDWKRAAVEGLAGSAMIEMFVLGWCFVHKGAA